ncbi:MAG: hypothetical protein P1S46_01880 [bacterium]|nr:hypothetical protein [bacterium]MDT8395856.1 CpsB/CapC family capsule biosynthesis tyrosine phosphatase [bacterium]
MPNLVDLHTHILPGLDDGAGDAEQSLRMLEGLEKLGFSHVFTTPHHRLYSWEGLEAGIVHRAVEDIRGRVSARGLEVKLYAGMEFDLDEALVERVLNRPGKTGPVLVDIGFWGVPRNLPGLLGTIPGAVCLVHPERNNELCRDMGGLNDLVVARVRLVGNLGSLSGMYGQQVRRRARELLEKDLYWALASDLHGEEQLDWIGSGMKELCAMGGPGAAKRLLSDNPMEAVINMEDDL